MKTQGLCPHQKEVYSAIGKTMGAPRSQNQPASFSYSLPAVGALKERLSL